MPADRFTLRQADQARTDFAIIEDELEAIHKRLSQLPTRREVWQAAMLGMLGGAVVAVTLIEAFLAVMFVTRILALACCLALASSLATAKTNRSLEVKHEFQRQHPCARRRGARLVHVPATSKITSSRSPAADPTRSRTCNGRRPPTRRPRTGGRGGVASLVSWTEVL